MTPGGFTIDVGDEDFEREVLDRSKTVPVVVDFWAPWCAPCRALGPLLEKLVAEQGGGLVLAKVNVDDAPAVAQAFGIRSIPAVKGFRDGQLIAEFVGAQPEAAVRQLLAAVLPTDADRLTREGEELAAAGDGAGAEARFRAALEGEPRHGRALVGLARALAGRGETTDALTLLERVLPSASVAPEAERLAAELRTRADGRGDEAALRTRLAADPGDLDARLALGRAHAAAGRYEDALAELLDVVRRDPKHADAAARKAMLDVFAVLGDDPLVDHFRGELAKALYK